jgi:hypothetical protein
MVVKHFFVSNHCTCYKVLCIRIQSQVPCCLASTITGSQLKSNHHCAVMTFYGKCNTQYVAGV